MPHRFRRLDHPGHRQSVSSDRSEIHPGTQRASQATITKVPNTEPTSSYCRSCSYPLWRSSVQCRLLVYEEHPQNKHRKQVNTEFRTNLNEMNVQNINIHLFHLTKEAGSVESVNYCSGQVTSYSPVYKRGGEGNAFGVFS